MNKNNKKNHMPITLRAKKSFLGRIVCRVAGEETGAVMMEYVIVATLIAAAVAVGVWFFGHDILMAFGMAGEATIGNKDQAIQQRNTAQANRQVEHQQADTADKQFIDANKEEGAVAP